MQHRAEIDGLRAIAVVPVILFHAGFGAFSGGFVGVDVFFVISGFLITSLILSDMDRKRFSLLEFYERRARRILPALFVVMLVCVPLAWFTMVPFQLGDFAQSLVAAVAFASNFLFFVESGYFEPEAELKPLLHTWSLAVEEQYYIIFPLLMLVMWRAGGLFDRLYKRTTVDTVSSEAGTVSGVRLMIVICSLLTLISLVWSQWSVIHAPAAAFFLLPSRGWEILAGGLAAFYLNRGRVEPLSLGAEQVLSALGMLSIVIPVFVYDGATLFPGVNALVPVIGALLVLLYTSPRTLVHRLLSHRALVGVGLVSYSAYLWHQPLIAFTRLRFGEDLPLVSSISLLVATGLLSVLSWHYVETPARRRGITRLGPLAATCATAVLAIGIFAYSGLRTDGFYDAKLAAIPADYARFVVDREAENIRRRSLIDAKPDVRLQAFDDTSTDMKVLIMGDSLSDDLLMSLRANQAGFRGYQFRRLRLEDGCVEAATAALQQRDEPAGTSPVCQFEVSSLLENELYEQADEIILHANFQRDNAGTAESFVRELVAHGKKVSVMGLMVFNDIASVSMKLHRSEGTPEEVFYQALRNKYLIVNDMLEAQMSTVPGARYLDKFSLFCSKDDQRCNILDESDRPIFIDGNHMSVDGFAIFGREMEKAGWFVASLRSNVGVGDVAMTAAGPEVSDARESVRQHSENGSAGVRKGRRK